MYVKDFYLNFYLKVNCIPTSLSVVVCLLFCNDPPATNHAILSPPRACGTFARIYTRSYVVVEVGTNFFFECAVFITCDSRHPSLGSYREKKEIVYPTIMSENIPPNMNPDNISDENANTTEGKDDPSFVVKKRSKFDEEEDCHDDDGTNQKRLKQQEEEEVEVLDIAEKLHLKAGDRIEVLWQIGGGGSVDNDDDDGNEESVAVVVDHWWGATLLPFDGQTTEDSVAIRVLEYDALPEHGFPDKSKEDVIFMGSDMLIDPDSQNELQYRMVAVDNDDEGSSAIISLTENDIEGLVNAVLEKAMAKVSGKFTNLPRSQQANFADLIAKKKEKLVGLLVAQSRKTTESTGKPLSARDMQELLAKAVADE
jgi:hypothetical protein